MQGIDMITKAHVVKVCTEISAAMKGTEIRFRLTPNSVI